MGGEVVGVRLATIVRCVRKESQFFGLFFDEMAGVD
jgi:hypothetical protein